MWHAERVEPWTLGLVAVILLGLAVILFGALYDRARNRRAAAEMLAPPRRPIPQFSPDSPAPTYLSDLQARRRPEEAPRGLSQSERERTSREIADPSTVRLDTGYVSPEFVTDPNSGQAVLDAPRVLVCSERVESTRELLPILERCTLSGTGLVIVAPSISDEVRATLEVNQIQRRLRVLAVTGADQQRVAAATGAQPRERSDLQSGYVWPQHLGGCARWISTAKASFVVGGVQ